MLHHLVVYLVGRQARDDATDAPSLAQKPPRRQFESSGGSAAMDLTLTLAAAVAVPYPALVRSQIWDAKMCANSVAWLQIILEVAIACHCV